MPGATPTHFKVIAFNTTGREVRAALTGWNVAPGQWRMSAGVDADGDDPADAPTSRTFAFEKSAAIDVTFPPGASVMAFALVTAASVHVRLDGDEGDRLAL